MLTVDPDVGSDEAQHELVRRAARDSLAAFILTVFPGYDLSPFHRALCRDIEGAAKKGGVRLGTSTPPQVGKSTIFTHLVAWHMGRNPRSNNMYVCYSATLVTKFARQIRDVLRSDLFGWIFPECTLSQDSQSLERMHTEQGGALLCMGAGGSITGSGISSDGICVLDDLVKDREGAESRLQMDKLYDWLEGVLFTRLHPGAALYLNGTRWSTLDMHQRIMDSAHADEWKWKNYPAVKGGRSLWPGKFSMKDLRRTERRVGPVVWESQYMCSPQVRTENSIDPDLWSWIEPERVPTAVRWCWGVDLAVSTKTSADESAMVRVGRDGDGNIYIGPGWSGKYKWPVCKRRIVETVKGAPCTLNVEAVAGFRTAVEELKGELAGVCRVKPISVSADKLSRALPWVSLLDLGKVYLLDTPGFRRYGEKLISQAISLGARNSHDDCVDGVTVGFEGLGHGRSRLITAGG